MSESFGEEVMGDLVGVGEIVLHVGEGVAYAAGGDWDGAVDSSLSMLESALGVATGGIFELALVGWDAAIEGIGLFIVHEVLYDATQAVGNVFGDGMFDLVGVDQSHQAVVSFDDGDYLGGIGHMAEGAADTIGYAVGEVVDSVEHVVGDVVDGVEQGAEDLWNEIIEQLPYLVVEPRIVRVEGLDAQLSVIRRLRRGSGVRRLPDRGGRDGRRGVRWFGVHRIVLYADLGH